MTKIFRLRAAITELIAPTEIVCLSCGKDVFDDSGFCAECASEVVLNNGKTCKRCGVGLDGEEDYCGNCAFERVYFDKGYSVFSYEGAVQRAILNMKFYERGSYAKVFAKYLARLVKEQGVQFDIVTFAPMTKKAKRKRRYNQAQLLAQYFCDILQCDGKLVEAIVKTKETVPQEHLDKTERRANLIGAYKLNADVAGKCVLVIDDVKTTGATLNECAKVLKGGGAASVIVLTVAARKEKLSFEIHKENLELTKQEGK